MRHHRKNYVNAPLLPPAGALQLVMQPPFLWPVTRGDVEMDMEVWREINFKSNPFPNVDPECHDDDLIFLDRGQKKKQKSNQESLYAQRVAFGQSTNLTKVPKPVELKRVPFCQEYYVKFLCGGLFWTQMRLAHALIKIRLDPPQRNPPTFASGPVASALRGQRLGPQPQLSVNSASRAVTQAPF